MLTYRHSIDRDGVTVRFSDKPDVSIRTMLKANGFRWSPAAGLWFRRRIAGAADFLAALDRKLNPGRADGACWRCQSPLTIASVRTWPRGITPERVAESCIASSESANVVSRSATVPSRNERSSPAIGSSLRAPGASGPTVGQLASIGPVRLHAMAVLAAA